MALLLSACAASRGALAGPRPREVAVVAISSADQPAPQTAMDDLAGAEDPRDLMVRESLRALRARGYEALPARFKGAPPGDADVARLAREAGVDAALVVRLDRMDLQAVRPLGRAEVDLAARMIAADGKVLWEEAVKGPTHVTVYRSQTDWRSHLRDALDRVLGELP